MKVKRITALLLALVFMLAAVPAMAWEGGISGVSGKTSSTQYFIMGDSALKATTFKCSEDGNAIGYSLNRNGEQPNPEMSKATVSDTVRKGIYTILQNGYPSQHASDYTTVPGLTDEELQYATAMALCAWMETNSLNGGVTASAVQPSAYPSLGDADKNMILAFTDGQYEANLKPGKTMNDLASYERAFAVYAFMYNAACTEAPLEFSGSLEIADATLWTPIDDEYVIEFTAKPTGEYSELWIDGLPDSATIYSPTAPNTDGSLDFAVAVPMGDFEGITPEMVMGHMLSTERYEVFSDGRSNSQMVAMVFGNHGEIARQALPMDSFASELTIKITDAASGAPIKGARVEVYERDKNDALAVISTYPEDASEYTTYKALVPGDYDFQITTLPVGYTAPTDRYKFSIGDDGKATGTTTVAVTAGAGGGATPGGSSTTTERTNDTLTVKHGTAAVSGVSITVYNQENTAALTVASDTAGNLNVAALAPGTYTYKISAVPETYAMDTRVRSLTVTDSGISGELDFTVEQTQFSVKKVNAANVVVQGVTYGLYDSAGTLLSSVVTDVNGIAKFTALKRGTFTIRETATVAGLSLSTDSYTFTVGADWTNATTPYLWESNVGGGETFAPTTRNSKTITLMHNVSTPVVGASVTVTNSSGTAVLSVTTNTAGVADVSSLIAGSYSYRVTTVPETYAIDGKPHTFEITDTGISGYIDLPVEKATVKVKKGTTSGVSYTLYNSSNNAVTSATTDSTGVATFVGLTLGQFYIQETAADSTKVYLPQSGSKYHLVSTCSSMTSPTEKTLKEAKASGYTACETCASGTAGSSIARYDFTVTNAWVNPTTPYDFSGSNQATTTSRADKTIKVTYNKSSAISGAILTVYNSAGTSVLTATTNAYGVADVSALAAGSYTYKVGTVPSTYAVDGKAHAFTIDSTGYISGEIDLDLKQVEVSVKKVAKNKTSPVSGVTYTLYNSSNSAITTAVTGSDGIATFRALVPGTYTIKETATVSGLTLSSESYTFTVTASWENGEPRVFYSSGTVQTGSGIYLLCTALALAAMGTAFVVINRIRRKAVH